MLMARPSVKSLLPRSLLGRSLAILLVPIVTLQIIVGYVFFQRHYQRVTEQMTANVAIGLRHAVQGADRISGPAEAKAYLAVIGEPLELTMTLAPGATVTPGSDRAWYDFSGTAIVSTLESNLHRPLYVDLASDARIATITTQTTHGALTTNVPRSRLSVSNPHQLLVLMIGAAILLGTVAILFMRNQVRPITRLAEAAEAFGKGQSVSYRPGGAEEVRRAGGAFLAMRARIERQIEQRTKMLSGVSHDLKTPLTRMKLTIALMEPSEESETLRADTDQMDRMLSEFLTFAKGDSSEETVATDPFALAEDIAEKARRSGQSLELVKKDDSENGRNVDRHPDKTVPLRPSAVSRAVQNLLGNAARYGSKTRLTVRLTPRAVIFVIEDDGPGISEADRQAAMQPFNRLDPSRNQNADGNVGLGLSIATDVARSHGGNLDLAESAELGGLAATLRLPR